MKMTMTDGTVFEGTLKEYAELIAFAETHQTINEAKVEAEYVAQEGDIVVVTANTNASANKVGDIGKITKLGDFGWGERAKVEVIGRRYNDDNNTKLNEFRKATPAEVEAYEKAVADASKPKLKVGDYVKLVKSKRGNNGAIAKIVDEGEFLTVCGYYGDFKLEHISGKFIGEISAATADQIVKATDEEVADVSKPKFKAGDFVKFEEPDLYDITSGKIYEVKTDDDGDLCIIDDAGDEDYSYLAEFAIKVDADEAAKQRESAKWAQIGRKVGEYKAGDIIGYTYDEPTRYYRVTRIDGEKVYFNAREFGNSEEYMPNYAKEIELIAPVESTLN